MRRGFAIADIVIATGLFALLAAMTATAAVTWRSGEARIQAARELGRRADSTLEQLRAGRRTLAPGRTDLGDPAHRPWPIAGSLTIEPAMDGDGRVADEQKGSGRVATRPAASAAGSQLLRCTVELASGPKGGQPVTVRLAVEMLVPPEGPTTRPGEEGGP